jgi:uncharacterized cupredoxin-like copper-binding protein
MTKPLTLLLAVASLLLPTLAGCGGGSGSASSSAPTGATVKMTEYQFEPSNLTVRRGTDLAVDNVGQIAHNLTIERGPNPRKQSAKLTGTSSFLPGRSERLKIDLKPGRYVMACTVPGHRELGMVGTLRVR